MFNIELTPPPFFEADKIRHAASRQAEANNQEVPSAFARMEQRQTSNPLVARVLIALQQLWSFQPWPLDHPRAQKG